MDAWVAIRDMAPLRAPSTCMARPGFFPLATDGKSRSRVLQLCCVLQFIDCINFEECYFLMANILMSEFCNQRFLVYMILAYGSNLS